jgi:nifR3 family TIM-barrel protein
MAAAPNPAKTPRPIPPPECPARDATPLNRDVPVAADGEFRPLRLGHLRVWPPVVLAPMAGVTNYPFRTLCREFGAGLYVSEMITARGFLEGNGMTRLLASGRPGERPRSVQLYGSNPSDLEETARVMVGDGVEHLDLNFGCPVPKVTRHGGGSAIPLRPRLMARLVAAAVRGAGTVPVTVKVRKGIDDRLLTFLDSGRVAESEGAAAIGLHARTAVQLYAGEADWDAVAALKAAVGIPVLGNGDVWECWDALRMLRATGCDGVIVGRGCLRRPWLFAELAAVFDGREPAPQPRFGQIAALMRRHAALLVEFFGPVNGIRQMRKWCAWYTAGFHNSAAARAALVGITSLEQMDAALARLDPDEPFPTATVRGNRVKDGRAQRRVALPDGYLADRDDDTPPSPPFDPRERAAFERALDAG